MLFPIETQTRELKSLDGIWRLCFDAERRGVEARYFEEFPHAQAIEIAVPGSINEQVVGREQHLNLDWVWYQTAFRVPATWWGHRVFLRIGAATYRADVYVNGQLVMWSEEYQAEMIERVLDAAARYPFVVGTHVWNFADFKVGQHPGRAMLNHKGVFTRDRAPKLAAHALRRRWA